jgi:hypothetical protein
MAKAKNPLRPKKVANDPQFRKDLAVEICKMIDEAMEAKGRLPERWKNCERRYRGEPDEQGVQVHDDSEPIAINIVKPRVDALVTKVCNPITSQRPYFSAFGYGTDRARLKMNEEVVQFLIERADFARKFRTATRLSCQAAPAVFKVSFAIESVEHLAGQSETSQDIPEPFKYLGPEIDVIHPNDFALYPLITGGIHAARLVGHRFAYRLREVKEKQQLGEYMDDASVYGGDDPQSWESGRAQDWSLTDEATGTTDIDDESVELWEVIVKYDLDDDGFEERYRAVVAKTSQELMEFEKYGALMSSGEFVPYSRPWYFPHAVVMPAYDEFYHANTIVQDLVPVQGAYSDGMTLMIEGGKMQAFPAGFITGGKLNEKAKRYKAGEYHYLENDVKIQWVNSAFEPTVWPMMFPLLEKCADGLIRISAQGTAQVQGETASESVIAANNMEEGADEYRDVAALAPEEMCDLIREYAYIHYGILKLVYQDQFPCENREQIKRPLRWEATGKTSDTNPQIVGQNIQEVLSLFESDVAMQALVTSGFNVQALLKGYLKTKRWPVAESDLFDENLAQQAQAAAAASGAPPPDAGLDPLATGGIVPPGPGAGADPLLQDGGALLGPLAGAGGTEALGGALGPGEAYGPGGAI